VVRWTVCAVVLACLAPLAAASAHSLAAVTPSAAGTTSPAVPRQLYRKFCGQCRRR
jgi:hypothetical protein